MAVLAVVGSWRRAFEVFGALGVVWAFFFYRWFRDNPHEHPSVNDAERQLLTGVDNLASSHAKVPWRVFFTSPSAWLLWIQYACLSYVWYFYVTWYPTYLDSAHGQALGPVKLAVLALLISLAGMCNDFVLPCAWGTCMDVGGRFAGTFSGAMNMMGNLGGFVAPIAIGYILDRTGSWNLTFYISSAVYLAGAVCWWLLDAETPLDRA